MIEALHAVAVLPAAAACCCAAADRARRAELAAGVVMTAAMLDAAWTHVLAPVAWAALLVVAAMTLGFLGRVRPGRPARSPHAAVGLVVAAALLVGAAAHSAAPSGHGHGVALGPLLVAATVAYTAWSAVRAGRRGIRPLTRLEVAVMGLSTALMGVAALA